MRFHGTIIAIDHPDASWAVIEGDWGLHRPGHGTPTVFYPYEPGINRWHANKYYPFTGRRPAPGGWSHSARQPRIAAARGELLPLLVDRCATGAGADRISGILAPRVRGLN